MDEETTEAPKPANIVVVTSERPGEVFENVFWGIDQDINSLVIHSLEGDVHQTIIPMKQVRKIKVLRLETDE